MQAMTEKDLPTLIAEQRQLILEKSVILDLLRKVRDEMHKLQVMYNYIGWRNNEFISSYNTSNCTDKGYVCTKTRGTILRKIINLSRNIAIHHIMRNLCIDFI
jgi:hypothetical protein